MGNVSSSGGKKDEEEVHNSMVQSPPHSPMRAYHPPMIFTPQAPVVPLQWPDEMMQNRISSDESKEKTREYGVPIMITWSHGGNEVSVEGSWDHWKTREYSQRTDKNDFTLMKVLPAGVYHFRFIVDGQWRFSADFPRECDDMGNVFNVLDLQEMLPEIPNTTNCPESPPSPASTYSSTPFTSEDFNVKVPDMPPLLQLSPLDQQPSSSRGDHHHQDMEILEKPSPAVLNHLYIQRGRQVQSTVALSSTHRFRAKYVTVVLYKSLQNLKK